jgi:hypothetical protein
MLCGRVVLREIDRKLDKISEFPRGMKTLTTVLLNHRNCHKTTRRISFDPSSSLIDTKSMEGENYNFENYPSMVKFLAHLRKNGADILFPPPVHDMVSAICFFIH